jgi:hypothetical protein
MKISDLRHLKLRRNGAIVSVIGFPVTRSMAHAYAYMANFLPNDKINLVRLTTDQIL